MLSWYDQLNGADKNSLGINGIWLSVPFAELATMAISIVFYLMFVNSYFKKLV